MQWTGTLQRVTKDKDITDIEGSESSVYKRNSFISGNSPDFVSEASKCDFDVDLGYNRIVVDAKSIMGVFSLDLTRSLTVRYPLKDDQFEVALNRFALN